MTTFGHFIDHGARYRITTPDTPAPWFNMLFNDVYALQVSQRGEGKTMCLKPERKDVFTGDRYAYIADGDDAPWSPLGRPVGAAQPESFECIHGLARTNWNTRRNGLSARITAWVPREGTWEIWRHTLTNESAQPKTVDYFAAYAFVTPSWAYVQEIACEEGILRLRNDPFRAPYESNALPNPGQDLFYLFSSRPFDSYACGEAAFFGSDDTRDIPLSVKNRRCPGGVNHIQPPLGAFHYQLALAPGETVELHIVGGTAVTMEEIQAIRAESEKPGYWDERLTETERHWDAVSKIFTIDTPDEGLNMLANFWLKKQATFMGRNDRGHVVAPVRNLLQDGLGYSLLDPDYVIERMIRYASWQTADGFLWQWVTLDGSKPGGNCLSHFKDAPFWLVSCIAFMLHDVADRSVLDREIPFKDSGSATLYEHLLRALYHFDSDTGSHGLCYIGEGDWFDPLNGPGRAGKGESTWLTMAFRFAVQQMIPICRLRNDATNAARLEAIDVKLGTAIATHCWDGDRFVGGFDDEGRAFASSADEEGAIFLNPQTWALISQSVAPERKAPLFKTLERLDTPFGPYITWPVYTKWNAQVGRISLKQPGTTENGSVYCHGAMFAAFAYCLEGLGEKAFEVIRRTLPTNPDNPPEVNAQVPLFVPNYYFGLKDSPDFGRSSQYYGTGTTAWLLLVTVDYLLGARGTAEGLVVDPVIPAEWKRFAVERNFRGARYRIAVENPRGVSRGVRSVTVNGTKIEGTVLPWSAGGDYDVRVELGKV